MKSKSECLQFNLVSPQKLSQGLTVDEATVLTVCALMQGSYDAMELNPRQTARLVEQSIFRIGHTKADRADIEASATEAGMWIFTHCSGCGFDFDKTSCKHPGHKVTFPEQGELLSRRSYLPPKVVQYITTTGRHKFDFRPPRP